jgi:hypothetical protein
LAAAVSGTATGPARTIGAAASADSPESLVSLLDDRCITGARRDDHINVIGRPAGTAHSANTARASISALSTVTRRLLVVAVTAVLSFATYATDSRLSAGLSVSAGKNQCEFTGSIAWDNQFDALRGVAPIQSVLPRRSR